MHLSEAATSAIIDELDFEDGGLIVAIARDVEDDTILMTAFMNEEAVESTLLTGEVHYWSRSRNAVWHKGATSGHTQLVREIHLDCDGDALLLDVEAGPTCHKGYQSCFFRRIEDGQLEVIDEPVFDPDDVYG